MDLPRYLTQHPESIGETYGEHLRHASGFGIRMIWAGFACLIHAALPFLFERTGSCAIAELHDRMVTHRARGNDGTVRTLVLRGQHVR